MVRQVNDYGVVQDLGRHPREVVLLNTVGGCSWAKCAFCDYCNTFGRTAFDAERHNREVLSHVTGLYGVLQVVCSANFVELPVATWFDLRSVCYERGIKTLLLETHWIHRHRDAQVREFFKDINVIFIYGIETFHFQRREVEWFKGYGNLDLTELASYADAVNLLIGVEGQTVDDITRDINIALHNFRYTFVYVFESNDTEIHRDNDLVEEFYQSSLFTYLCTLDGVEILDGMDRRAPDHMGYVGSGARY